MVPILRVLFLQANGFLVLFDGFLIALSAQIHVCQVKSNGRIKYWRFSLQIILFCELKLLNGIFVLLDVVVGQTQVVVVDRISGL